MSTVQVYQSVPDNTTRGEPEIACYRLSPAQTRCWDEGFWERVAIEDDVIEWCFRDNIRVPVLVVTHDHRIAFETNARTA